MRVYRQTFLACASFSSSTVDFPLRVFLTILFEQRGEIRARLASKKELYVLVEARHGLLVDAIESPFGLPGRHDDQIVRTEMTLSMVALRGT